MNEDAIAVFIPIIAITMSLSIPIVYAIVDYKKRRSIIESYHKERMLAIERGMEVPALPEEYFQAPRKNVRSRYLLWGMIWTFLGAGLFAFLTRLVGEEVGLVALMPIGVGLALLIFYVVEGRRIAHEAAVGTDVATRN